jgi:hypothetical protein
MQLEQLLERLKMEHLQATLDSLCEHASKEYLNYREFLTHALAQGDSQEYFANAL